MSPITGLEDVLDPQTAEAWPLIATVAPRDAVLMGGTGLAVHLHHRISRDLDLFTSEEFDPEHLERQMMDVGLFATTLKAEGTLCGVLGATRVQFLWARGQKVLQPGKTIAGLTVGSLPDLFATKLKVIGDRGELRDYFDVMHIELHTGRRVEEGLQLYMARYGVEGTHPSIEAIIGGLGYFDDVTDDPYLLGAHGPGLRDEVIRYWTTRQPQIVASLDPRP